MEELKHALVVAEPQACLSTAQTEADLGLSSLLCLLFFQAGRRPSVAFACVCVGGGVIMTDGTHKRPGAAGPAQMGCLKFLPAKRALSPSSSSILEESGSRLVQSWT